MDVLNISNKFMTGLMSKILNVVLKKLLGCDVKVRLDELKVTTQENDVEFHLNVNGSMTQDEFKKLMMKLV